MKNLILIGYSGHAFVVADAIYSRGGTIRGYCDSKEKIYNPYNLAYLGSETIELISGQEWIVGIGDNVIREKVINQYSNVGNLVTISHNSSLIGALVTIGVGTFLAANTVINPLATIGKGCIINTGAIIEHECTIGDYTHICPGAVLAGNVKVGKRSFIGANAVVKQGVRIGNDVIVGAGSVIIRDIKDGIVIVGNPGKKI